MRVVSLDIFQYRNFDREQLEFSPAANIFVGKNGQGKTNLLESIHLLGYGRSFRTSVPRECIQHGQSECRVSGTVSQGAITRELQVVIRQDEKLLLIHGKHATLEDFLGSLHVLAFTGEHLKVIRGGPIERRSFLDRAMVTIYPGHIRHLAAYGRALKQRNRILANTRDPGRSVDAQLLDSWDETLVREGSPIVWNRIGYVQRMKEQVPSGLFGTETLKMHYTRFVHEGAVSTQDVEQQFRGRLLQSRTRDLQMGFTTTGPHRDDLKLYLNGKPLAEFGSAGQQRSCLLSLYFAQMHIHRDTHGFYPVFLVDDVEAELDDERLHSFLQYVADRTQTFLTTAKENLLPGMPGPALRFEVSGGHISGPSQV